MNTQVHAAASPHDEAAVPRREISKLQRENRRLRTAAQHADQVESALRERVKELDCLYGIAQVVESSEASLPSQLQRIVGLLPPSWQYPNVCCARVLLEGQAYVAGRFREAPWKQLSGIVVRGETIGVVEVYYLKARPESDEGPFLKEERALIDAVAEQVGKVVQRARTERQLRDALKQLQVERTALQQANAALHGVLTRIEDEKREVQDSIMANVDKVLMPVLHALETEIAAPQKKYVAWLKENLEEITSPFADRISKAFTKLTAVEIHVCEMIRNGMGTKEIAELRHVSPATVARQRESIRKKLNLAGTDTNLATYLGAFLSERTHPRPRRQYRCG